MIREKGSSRLLWFVILQMRGCMTKRTNWHLRPAKTQISLGIRPVWSESSLSAWRKVGSLATHWAHSEESDQTGRMPRLIWVCAGCTDHFVGFVMSWFKWACPPTQLGQKCGSLSKASFSYIIIEPCHEKTCLQSLEIVSVARIGIILSSSKQQRHRSDCCSHVA